MMMTMTVMRGQPLVLVLVLLGCHRRPRQPQRQRPAAVIVSRHETSWRE